MKQGIVISCLLISLSFGLFYGLLRPYQDIDINDAYVTILKDGEEIYSSPLLNNNIVWIVEEEDDNLLILENEEIIEYYDFEVEVTDLLDIDNVDFKKIIEVSGEDSEINMIHIVDNSVTMYEANCKDQICVNVGTITKPGQTITCAPHKLVVKIEGESELDA